MPVKPTPSRRMRPLLALALLGLVAADRQADWVWRSGRATHYGGPGDPWSIHQGSCQYYYLDPNVNTGWDIAAPGDQNWDWDGGSCGRCYEVACAGAVFKDGYGNQLDRKSVCYDESATVVVQVTDVCPCYYPTNYYSNKRWCCGDMYHLDISTYAFEKLADKKWGVIAMKYRQVPCGYVPNKVASLPQGTSGSPPQSGAPWGWSASKDKRPRFSTSSTSSATSSTGTVSGIISNSMSSAYSYSTTGSGGGSPVSLQGSTMVLSSGVAQGWTDASYSSRVWTSGQQSTPTGNTAYCTTISAGGAMLFKMSAGAFAGKKVVDFWVQRNSWGIPNLMVTILGPKGLCRDIGLQGVSWTTALSSSWVHITLPLNAFSWTKQDWSTSPAVFQGCGAANLSDREITGIQFKNQQWGDQGVCMDRLQLA
ncbi:RlpA-like double-psi beta-barrel-protein domain-containing protein-containing protein [Haematococcus lacustris]